MIETDRQDGFWAGWTLALALSAGLLALVLLPPFVGPAWRSALMQGFAQVCHQLPERSLLVGSVPLAVCHRCLGIYAGLPLAVLAVLGLWRYERVLGRHPWPVLALAVVPMTVDWGGDVVGLWVNSPLSRVLTGGVFGLVAGFFFTRALVQALQRRPDTPVPASSPASPS